MLQQNKWIDNVIMDKDNEGIGVPRDTTEGTAWLKQILGYLLEFLDNKIKMNLFFYYYIFICRHCHHHHQNHDVSQKEASHLLPWVSFSIYLFLNCFSKL